MSEDETLLRDLGKHVRETERTVRIAQLEGLCRGELAEAQRPKLDGLDGHDSEHDDERALRAYAPLSQDVKTRIAQQVLDAVLASHRRKGVEARYGSGIRRRTGVPRWTWLVAVLAPIATVLLYFATLSPVQPAVLAYSLELSGQAMELRSAAPAAGTAAVPVARLAPNTRLQIVLRPATESEGSASAFVFVVVGGRALSWPAELVQAPTGALRVALEPMPPALRAATRAYVVVSLPAVDSREAAELALGEAEHGPGFQRFAIDLQAVDAR
jgi:hypothetical protein